MESNTPAPAPAQIALALAIVKLKPAGLDVKEFILQIRESIKVSKSAEFFHSPDKFFDSVSFWRQAYEKSEAEKSKLLDRIFELEQRNEDLVAKLHREELKSEILQMEEIGIPGNQETMKRSVADDQTARKRHKKQSCPLETTSADTRALYHDVTSQNKMKLPLIRQSCTLRKALQKRSNNADIVQSAITLCNACEDELTAAVSHGISKNKLKNEALPLNLVIRSIEFAIGLLLKALGKLYRNRGSKEAGVLIYNIVQLYEAALNCLRQYCKAHAVPINPVRTNYPVLTRSRTVKPAKPSVEADDPSGKDEEAIQLTSLLHIMVKSLNLKCPEHQRLLEGFLYILLRRAGKTLCLFVFQDLHLQPDLRMEPQELPLPAGLVDDDFDDKSLGAAQAEAKYIVYLLRKALDLLYLHQPDAPSEDHSGMHFLSSLKAKIQSTLLQAVFGTDSDYGESLKETPKPRNSDIKRFCISQEDSDLSVPEWYIQELWQLVGWEALADNTVL